MAGLWRGVFCVLAFSVLASGAHAFGGRLGSSPPTGSYYYAAPSVYWIPYSYCPPLTVPTPRVIPVPDAVPKPAPPSPTGEPPLQKAIEKKASNDPRMPLIVTSHAVGGNYVPGSAPLAKDRSVTLDLERQFSWQVEGQPQHVERVGETQTTLELVIRD